MARDRWGLRRTFRTPPGRSSRQLAVGGRPAPVRVGLADGAACPVAEVSSSGRLPWSPASAPRSFLGNVASLRGTLLVALDRAGSLERPLRSTTERTPPGWRTACRPPGCSASPSGPPSNTRTSSSCQIARLPSLIAVGTRVSKVVVAAHEDPSGRPRARRQWWRRMAWRRWSPNPGVPPPLGVLSRSVICTLNRAAQLAGVVGERLREHVVGEELDLQVGLVGGRRGDVRQYAQPDVTLVEGRLTVGVAGADREVVGRHAGRPAQEPYAGGGCCPSGAVPLLVGDHEREKRGRGGLGPRVAGYRPPAGWPSVSGWPSVRGKFVRLSRAPP